MHTTADRLEATLLLDAPVDKVRLVSPQRARALAGMGIHTVRDLLENYPLRYMDLSAVKTIAQAEIGAACTLRCQVHEVKLKRPRRNLPLVEVALVDGTGTLVVTAFRQPWLADSLKPGMAVAVAGKVEFNYGFKRMTNPFIEEIGDQDSGLGMVVPVHPSCAKVKRGMMKRLVANALEATVGLMDPLPLGLRTRYRLMSRQSALRAIHFPADMAERAEARRRLAYEELLLLELALQQDAAARAEGKDAERHTVDGPHLEAFRRALPFTLGAEQQKAVGEILGLMASGRVMNHMLLGDVGTGKTIVAAQALVAAADSGCQALLLAPTEILATQHAQSLGPLLRQAGVRMELLTGSTPAGDRAGLLQDLACGNVDVLVGTHAVLEDDVVFQHCSLVVVDEQQRFGVGQRAKAMGKGACPDALFLTATPIPRSLALALYGNLTLSYLHERPSGAPARKTFVHAKTDRGAAYDAARAALGRGERVYVVCPLVGEAPQESGGDAGEEAEGYASVCIEDDADMDAGDLAAAEKQAAYLRGSVFPDYHVGLVHGKLTAAEKAQVMEDFRTGEVQVLVATTVIEVGVDVPEATVMIVEDADRFGLAQLHQLRGRVGRGGRAGEVHLVSSSKAPAALERLAAMEKTEDGFELATLDLSLRREGDILGNRQHGASGLKLVNIVRDGAMVEAAHADARELLEGDPHLQTPALRALAREMRAMFPRDATIVGG